MEIITEEEIREHRKMVEEAQQRANRMAAEVAKKYQAIMEQDVEGDLHKLLSGR